MDVNYELNGTFFRWDAAKAKANPSKHDGVTFVQAASVFFDPFFRMVDASRNDEDRNAVIGFDVQGRLLFVVHLELEIEYIRIISARKATRIEREFYDS